MIIAQLSDIHADGSAEALDRLDSVMDWLAPLKPDAIIVSGDLVEDHRPESYRAVRERLEGASAPFFVVPGNVDDHGLMRHAFGDRFGWDFERPLNVVGDVGPITILGLDVTVAGAHHGNALPVLDWLRDALAQSIGRVLIFQHQHPFLCGVDGKDRNLCLGGEELATVIQASEDKVISLTCGHVHRPMFTRFAGRQATMAPSVARANRLKLDGKDSTISDPPGLMLHHFDEGRLVSHVVMVS